MPSTPQLHVVIPAMDEADTLPLTLQDLASQSRPADSVTLCINQPDAWWENPEHLDVCENNLKLLHALQADSPLPIKVLDHCSPGAGWTGKRPGVGRARRVLMDAVAGQSADTDLIINLDADTRIAPDYLKQIEQAFDSSPEATGLSAPYYHRLTGEDVGDRAILLYEIYMRHYLLNLFRINSPHAFTAMGSAMACPVGIYRKLGGITPHQSGEDFYFIQKLAKSGRILQWTESPVYPSARSSTRVPFGTGAAVRQLSEGNPQQRWPLYAMEHMDFIREATQLFPLLYKGPLTEGDAPGELKAFLGPESEWAKVRNNCRTEQQFIRSANERLDGLRILQFLRTLHEQAPADSGCVVRSHLSRMPFWHPELADQSDLMANSDRLVAAMPAEATLSEFSTDLLASIRDVLKDAEWLYRKKRDTLSQ